MATAAKATVSLHLDVSGIVAQLRGLADAIEAIAPNVETAPRCTARVGATDQIRCELEVGHIDFHSGRGCQWADALEAEVSR